MHYIENIVEMFDKLALEAVENYQKTVAVEEKTQEEVKGNERREETREAFLGRAGKALLEVNERGTLAFGFRQCSGKLSAEVQAAEERLKKIGIPVIVIEHMESNKNGVTSIHHGDAMAIPGIAVFIHKDTKVPAMEIVGHEGFHFLAALADRMAYVETLMDNIDFEIGRAHV